jgi:predicted homoserine dehydrogenase-like protein
MVHKYLAYQYGSDKQVRVGIIGAGVYGTGIVTQASCVPGLEIAAIADKSLENAKHAYRSAGVPEDAISICEDRNSALAAIESGKYVITEDPTLLMELPIDIIVESTGAPEAGALHAHEAIRHGKHVVMVTKEADVTVGPILKHLADEAGLIYTAADGDQHGLLMGLVSWARGIGLEVICGGKARNGELCYDPIRKTVSDGRNSIALIDEEFWMFQPVPAGQAEQHISARREKLAGLDGISKGDITEMTIAANATGLCPDVSSLHSPPLYTSEIPEVFCHSKHGGILSRNGVIDAVICLRYPHEAGLGGGVFIVVDSANEYSRRIIKGGVSAQGSNESAFLITRPCHLRGVETINTILAAALQGVPTGALEYLPRYDVGLKATRNLKAGEILGDDSSMETTAFMMPAVRVKDGVPLPSHMASGNTLAVNITQGTVITREMVVSPSDSVLWSLRTQQDRHFLLPIGQPS